MPSSRPANCAAVAMEYWAVVMLAPMPGRADLCAGSCRRWTSAMHRGNGPPWAPCRPRADAGSVRSDPLRSASRPALWPRTGVPLDDLEKSLVVEHADITCAEITVGGKRLGIGFRLLPIAAHDLGALGADFARLADRRFIVIAIEQFDIGRRQWKADG